jgi:hypothetical protein
MAGALVLFVVLFIGIRPVSVKYFTDSANYHRYYEFFMKKRLFTLIGM